MPNLSQIKRQRMLEFLNKIREEHKNDDEALIAINEIEKELSEKKYGLVWEEHQEQVDIEMQTKAPVFTEIKEREIVSDKNLPYNFLLEGDNLHSLKLLEKTHKGKIDLIYIDPPYNTGSKDFKYDDNYVVSEDSFRHSKWLSFMKNRLLFAKELLSEKGCIFISIDDNEIAQLKLLCDDIFEADNHLGNIIQNKQNAKNDSIDIQKNHEYIVCYRKKANYKNGTSIVPTLVRRTEKLRPAFEENGRFYYINDAITTRGEGGTLNARPNLGYTVYYNPNTKDKKAVQDYDVELARTAESEDIYIHDETLIENGYVPIIPPKVRGKLGCWTWSLEKFNDNIDNIIITGSQGKYAVKKRTFVPAESIVEIDGKMFYSSTEETNSKSIIEFSTNDGTNVLTSVLGESGTFSTPKNLEMIKYLLSLYQNKNSLILDFFAGSGTTAQAVMELNSEDNGNRKFILCTNNENGICENITYQRIKTVITGKRRDGSDYSEGIPANLKYYKTDFVDLVSEDWDYSLSDELLKHIAEMVQLEYAVRLDQKAYVVLLSDNEIDAFVADDKRTRECKAVYISASALITDEQTKILKSKNISTFIIPDYYFEYELREADER